METMTREELFELVWTTPMSKLAVRFGVSDVALAKTSSLLDQRYLDPACGSGIFLVGLFNRIAEEWKQANPEARNDRRARELRKILCSSLAGVDKNPTACRITAFSLYLAYLDQLRRRRLPGRSESSDRQSALGYGSV